MHHELLALAAAGCASHVVPVPATLALMLHVTPTPGWVQSRSQTGQSKQCMHWVKYGEGAASLWA